MPSTRSPHVPLVSETSVKALSAARAQFTQHHVLGAALARLESVREASLKLLEVTLLAGEAELPPEEAIVLPPVSEDALRRYAGSDSAVWYYP